MDDARTEAEAAFKRATVKVAEAPPKKNAVPGVKEQVTLRLDQDVLELCSLAKKAKPRDRETVIATLRSIRDYRRLHPRRYEADRPLDEKSEAGARGRYLSARVPAFQCGNHPSSNRGWSLHASQTRWAQK